MNMIRCLCCLCLWNVNFTKSFPVPYSTLRYDKTIRVGWDWIFPFPQVVRSNKPEEFRLL
jgi:hypothetical protein